MAINYHEWASKAITYGERIKFLPARPATELRGILRGLDTGFERDEQDRL